MDIFGDHLLSCSHSSCLGYSPTLWRHDSLLRNLASNLRIAGRQPSLEKKHTEDAHSRPDIKCMGEEGEADYLDLTFVNPLSSAKRIKTAIRDPLAILRTAEKVKVVQHAGVLRDSRVGDNFIVLGITTFGGWSSYGRDYFKRVAMGTASISQDNQRYRYSLAFHRLAAKIIQNSVYCLTEGIDFDSDA